MVEKLGFTWDEVHEVAEQLEHIKSPLLIKKLDEFLAYPKYDPHGDPIPNEKGEFKAIHQVQLSQVLPGKSGVIVSVKNSNSAFLKYLDKIGAYIGAKVEVLDKAEFDNSLEISIDNRTRVSISSEVSKNILITE